MEQTSVSAYASSDIGDYVRLLKLRVMSLVVFSGGAGLLVALASGASLHLFLSIIAIACIAAGCGGAACINMWYERDLDALMKRTQNRPLVQGRIEPSEAISFGVALSFGSVGIMGIAVNWVAAFLLAVAIFFYVFIYTIWLKPRTPQNIVIGGAAGAFPPMIGWAAVTGDISLASLSLFLLIFVWTPPHFWSLALYRSEDYRNAGIPVLPVVKGEKSTKRHILFYTLMLLPISLLPYYLAIAGKLYAITAIILGGLFIIMAIQLYFENSHKSAPRLFGFSIFYLFALFTMLIVDNYV